MPDSFIRSARRRTRELLTVAVDGGPVSRTFDQFLLALILLNVAAVIAESVQPLGERFASGFRLFEIISVVIFSCEYVLRVWSCVEDERYSHPVTGRLRYAASPLALIDLLAIAPFYLTFLTTDLRVLRILRIFRLLRMAKIARYSQTLQIFGRVLIATRMQLLLTLTVMTVLLLISSSLMYAVEQEVQPEAFSSIPAAMWWAIATLTTVGYGDIYPVTVWGKLLGSLISVIGIGMFALPTAVLGAAFLDEARSVRKIAKCPHCGEDMTNHQSGTET
ncbi:MAG: ion transporter [Halobacteria archaeon]|nr:ion transporter [Halobacteria archaeon]